MKYDGWLALKKQIKLFLYAATLGLCAIAYAITMLPQDRIFSEYKRAFHEIQHPAGTKLIKIHNGFGALDKTRVMYKEDFPQGCDYRVGAVREYSGSQENIKSFYAAQNVNVLGEEIPIGILFIPREANGLIDPYAPISMELGSFDILEDLRAEQEMKFLNLDPQASYYFISIGSFSRTDIDLRCQF